MISIEIPYGSETLTFTAPERNLGEVLRPNRVELPADPDAEIAKALAHPIGAEPLDTLAQGKSRVLIICDDLTRPTPADRILPVLVNRLNDAGVSDDQIMVMMALGTHRPMTDAEMIAKLGADMLRRLTVVNSEFHDKTKLRYMGQGANDAPIWIDARVLEADSRIAVGTIFPHPAAGWGGGAKMIYPGVAGEETVRALHLQQGETPRNLVGDVNSPVRASIESWTERVGLDFILNLIYTPKGSIYRAVAGHYVKAHRQGVRHAREVYGVRASARADIVVSSSHPADLDMWQASKAACISELLVADGGTLILVTPCPEGMGPHPEFAEYIGTRDPEALLDAVRDGSIPDPIAASGGATMARMRDRIQFALVSDGLTRDDAAAMGMAYYDSVQQALDACLRKYGPSARVSVVPYGAEILPLVQ